MTSARDQIIRILQSLTDISAAELGRRVGVSRERVRQILKDLGYPTARGKGRPYGPAMVAPVALPTGRRINKLAATKIVAEDLLGKGYAIFAPIKSTRACDLIAIDGHGAVSLISICLAGKHRDRTRGARPPGSTRSAERRCAWVVNGAPVRYEPPLARQRRPARSN